MATPISEIARYLKDTIGRQLVPAEAEATDLTFVSALQLLHDPQRLGELLQGPLTEVARLRRAAAAVDTIIQAAQVLQETGFADLSPEDYETIFSNLMR